MQDEPLTSPPDVPYHPGEHGPSQYVRDVRDRVEAICRTLLPKRSERDISHQLDQIIEVTNIAVHEGVALDRQKLLREQRSRDRYRCDKCHSTMLATDSVCRICENNALLGCVGTLRTLMRLSLKQMKQAHDKLLDEVKREHAPGRADVLEPVRAHIYQAFILASAAMDEDPPKISGRTGAWASVSAFLGIGSAWFEQTRDPLKEP